MSSRIYPVILSGGVGKRLWPLSRSASPKQFLALFSEHTMFQETLLRLKLSDWELGRRFAAPIVIANETHAGLIKAQLAAIGVEPSAVLLEPAGRNTAPAAAAAALWVSRDDPRALILLLPADHYIADVAAFYRAIETATPAAEAGLITTFGITPTSPETGYGYIEQGASLSSHEGVFQVARFVEKPNSSDAARYLASGRFLWNSGMFLFRADTLISEMKQHCPSIPEGVERALPIGARDGMAALSSQEFSQVPSEAIDTAVMERTSKAAVVPASIGWSDVGSFAALWQVGARDTAGNVVRGDAVLRDTVDSFVHAGSRCVATIGIDGLVIVETPDAVLVAKRDAVQDIKAVVEELEHAGRRTLLAEHQAGELDLFDIKPGYPRQLKSYPGHLAQLTVLAGQISVTLGTDSKVLHQTQSIIVPANTEGLIASVGDRPARCLLVVFPAH